VDGTRGSDIGASGGSQHQQFAPRGIQKHRYQNYQQEQEIVPTQEPQTLAFLEDRLVQSPPVAKIKEKKDGQ